MTLKTVLARIQLVLMALAVAAMVITYRYVLKPSRHPEPEDVEALREDNENELQWDDEDESVLPGEYFRDMFAAWSSLTTQVREHTENKCERCVGMSSIESAQVFWTAMSEVQQEALSFGNPVNSPTFMENLTTAQERWDELHGKEPLF